MSTTKQETESYSFSTDGMEFMERYPSREEAFRDAVKSDLFDPGERVWTGRIKEGSCFVPQDGYATVIAEIVDEAVEEATSAEDRCFDFSPEDRKELDALIYQFILERGIFSRWGIDDIQEHAVTEADLG